MKKIKYLIFLFLLFPYIVMASSEDKINKIDVKIELSLNGDAHIIETWDAYAGSGSEFYKALYNLGNMSVSNFKVTDESGTDYDFVTDWDINASMSEKKYKNGFNYASEGLELCWGKSGVGSHIYVISYDVSNFIFKTRDAQVMYWTVLNNMDMMPKSFSAEIVGPTMFSDTLNVWGYGYKGYAYVYDGKAYMSNEEDTDLSSSDYAVMLIKFPLNTFTVSDENTYSQYEYFDDVLNKSKENSFDYDYSQKTSIFQKIFAFISAILPFLIFFGVVLLVKASKKYKLSKTGKINEKEVKAFRDIPCDKDIFKAYLVSLVYKLNKKNTDFFGAVFLKWLFEDKIEIKKISKTNIFGKEKEDTAIVLKENIEFETDVERKLYKYLSAASKDGILEKNELKKWSQNNYNKLFNWFDDAESYGRSLYSNFITKKGFSYIVDDGLKKDGEQLAGLKKFLVEFSRIEEKEALEVKLWKEYLMFAQIFGLAEKVAKQFEKLYPEVIEQFDNNINMTDIMILNNISNTAIVSATTARSHAESYSSGGGGFSSGGGGGGSFGGGGGGGR